MSTQTILTTTSATVESPDHFKIHSQDPKLKADPQPVVDPTNAPLGILSKFTGTFAGRGFNSIFRPNSGPPTTTTFPKPVTNNPGDNVLELNLTVESLKFGTEDAPTLGSVPNRGEQPQADVFLNGVPYLQQISDVTNVANGKADGKPSGIHFEPGLWMHVPATSTDPVLGESLVRMGSIPHGTTINAQCLAPTTSFEGPPQFPTVDMTPFVIGDPSQKIRFASQTSTATDSARLPQDLSKFIAAGTITQDVLDNPNVVLEKANVGKVIKNTTVFTVSTAPTAPELGGGTANIAFLQGASGSGSTGPNALAIQMSATFWINEVVYKVNVPALQPGHECVTISASEPHPGALVPTFEVPAPSIATAARTINVVGTEIQYSQQVMLNFAGLTWPHISVATLIPSGPVHVQEGSATGH